MADSNTEGESWNSIRKKVLQRDDYKCQFCGITETLQREQQKRGLHVHHKIPSSEGGSDNMENLITVCPSCHKQLESVTTHIYKKLKRKEMSRLMEHGSFKTGVRSYAEVAGITDLDDIVL